MKQNNTSAPSKNTFLFIAVLFCAAACNFGSQGEVNKAPVNPTPVQMNESVTSSRYVEFYGAVGDGKTDDTKAFENAIRQSADRTPGSYGGERSGWGAVGATEIKLSGNKVYRITRPLVIPNGKNITLRSDAMGGALILYDGPGNIALDVEPKGTGASLCVEGINFKYGGIRLTGAMRGKILIENNQFIETRGPAIDIADKKDIGDGNSQSFGVVFWVIRHNEFHYCNQGIKVVSKSILVGTIELNRFRYSINEPLWIDGNGISVHNNEFMAIKNPEASFIRLIPENNPVALIKITDNRFGSEAVEKGGEQFASPLAYIIFDRGKSYMNTVTITGNYFFTNKTHIKVDNSANHAISFRQKTASVVMENNFFRGFKQEIVEDNAETKSSTFSRNKIVSPNPVFKRGGVGFEKERNDEQTPNPDNNK